MSKGEFKKRMDALQQKEVYANTNLYADLVEWIEEAKKEFLSLIPRETKDSMYLGCASLIDSSAVYLKITKWFGEDRRV